MNKNLNIKKRHVVDLNIIKLRSQALGHHLVDTLKSSTQYNYDIHFGLLFIINTLIRTNSFHPVSYDLQKNVNHFSKFFYKKIRGIQAFIKFLRFKIKDLYNLKLLKLISRDQFLMSGNAITAFNSSSSSTFFNSQIKELFSSNSKSFEDFLKIQTEFGLSIKTLSNSTEYFNLYLFQLYIKLYDLEDCLQLVNWTLFKSGTERYRFRKEFFLIKFLKEVNSVSYNFWHTRHFKVVNFLSSKRFKLKKKWRFWREFKRCLLFDKVHLLVKFEWLHNHKRILNHQYLESYSIRLNSKLNRMYKKKTTKSRLLVFLNNLEYRLDILSMRVFTIKSIKWVWILLYFGYLTVNFKSKKKKLYT